MYFRMFRAPIYNKEIKATLRIHRIAHILILRLGMYLLASFSKTLRLLVREQLQLFENVCIKDYEE